MQKVIQTESEVALPASASFNFSNTNNNNFVVSYNAKGTARSKILNLQGLPQNSSLAALDFTLLGTSATVVSCHWHTQSDVAQIETMTRGKRVRLYFSMGKEEKLYSAEGTLQAIDALQRTAVLTNVTTDFSDGNNKSGLLYLGGLSKFALSDTEVSPLYNQSILACQLSQELTGPSSIIVKGAETYMSSVLKYSATLTTLSMRDGPNFTVQQKLCVRNNYKWPLVANQIWYTEERARTQYVSAPQMISSRALTAVSTEVATVERAAKDAMRDIINDPLKGAITFQPQEETLVMGRSTKNAVKVYGRALLRISGEQQDKASKRQAHMVVRSAGNVGMADVFKFSGSVDVMLARAETPLSISKLGTYIADAWSGQEEFVLKLDKSPMLIAKVRTTQVTTRKNETVLSVELRLRNKFPEAVLLRQILEPPSGYTFVDLTTNNRDFELRREDTPELLSETRVNSRWTLEIMLPVSPDDSYFKAELVIRVRSN